VPREISSAAGGHREMERHNGCCWSVILGGTQDERDHQQVGLVHEYADLGDVVLHYVVAGEGEPVVLLHGWPQTWYEWRKVIPQLARHYRVIVPDMRGAGDRM
jgi:hypothetical protein